MYERSTLGQGGRTRKQQVSDVWKHKSMQKAAYSTLRPCKLNKQFLVQGNEQDWARHKAFYLIFSSGTLIGQCKHIPTYQSIKAYKTKPLENTQGAQECSISDVWLLGHWSGQKSASVIFDASFWHWIHTG